MTILFTETEVRELLDGVNFQDWAGVERVLNRLMKPVANQAVLTRLLPKLRLALTSAANPDRVFTNFDRFVHNVPDPVALFDYLDQNQRAIDVLITLFAGSQFLTEILLRHPHYFTQLLELKRLAQQKSAAQLYVEAQEKIAPFLNGLNNLETALDDLRRFQRWELLRIGICDLLDLFDFETVTLQLSHLAKSLVQACLSLAIKQESLKEDEDNLTGFVVIAMGKLGGEELNYSSDIDLLFLCEANPTAYQKLGQHLIDALTRTTAEGFLYRVDMRLRPWGKSGSLVYSTEAHLSYLRQHAGLWERQALLKAHPIAGDNALAKQFLQQVETLPFDVTNETVRQEIHTLKQRIEEKLRSTGRVWGEVKSGEGSIRDIEFIVQYLQLVYGQQHRYVRSANTLDGLARLLAGNLLPPAQHRVLVDGYVFLRTVEHYLQLMNYRQTHTLPSESTDLYHLAQRLGFKTGEEFIQHYEQHATVIRQVYAQYLELQPLKVKSRGDQPMAAPTITQHLRRMHPSYATTFSERDIEQHAIMADLLTDHHLVEVKTTPLYNGDWRVTIVGYDYLGELSLICGLLFSYGFNILDAEVFSYQRPTMISEIKGLTELNQTRISRIKGLTGLNQGKVNHAHPSIPQSRSKIVDVFTVRPATPGESFQLTQADLEIWERYTKDLAEMLQKLHHNQQTEAQGELVKRVAVALKKFAGTTPKLSPVDIEIDNDSSDRHTVLHIYAPDTIGFLYEFTNALALNGINIRRMNAISIGDRIYDTLYVTNTPGEKITAPQKQRELRVATALIKHFTHLLPNAPNPESAMLHFRELIGQLFRRPDWPDEISSLEQPEVLDTLARLLGVSDFLWKDFLRMQHANLFPIVRDTDSLAIGKTKSQLQTELETELQGAGDFAGQIQRLNAFKDREMFRIDMRQILEHITDFGQFSAELTDLAEVVVERAYLLCFNKLQGQFGTPCLENGQPCPLTVGALGKFGGRELGFASDIELMFIFAGTGQTTVEDTSEVLKTSEVQRRVITTTEFYTKLVQEIDAAIESKQDGIFELDLRLRPYGKAGSIAVSLDAFRRYFATTGDAWPYERQALIRLRPVGGDMSLGDKIIKLRDQFVYTGEPFDVAAMRAMRERQLRHLVTAGTINAKFSPGGMVDIEYLVQGLQITHGQANPNLRHTNTYQAMLGLAVAGILTQDDYTHLLQAHIFMRRLINALRMARGNAKDLTVPSTASEEFAYLARRLNYGDNSNQLLTDLTQHTSQVQEINLKLLGTKFEGS